MKSKKSLKPILTNALILAIFAGIYGGVRYYSKDYQGDWQRDEMAISFELPLVTADLSYQGVRLADYQGKMLLVNFWASWCNVCRQETKVLNDLQAELGDRLSLVAIASYDNPLDVKASARFQSASYPIAIDPDGKTALDYKAAGLPYSLLIDATGKVIQRLAGPLTDGRVGAIKTRLEKIAQAEANSQTF